ncbi:MAG: glycosyltransferase [Oscillospiraceae bacterium]|nr:glycosyltransferase [Oscillospiraceae bacterium]
MKLLTFAVPCYNSAAYMEHCIETLLTGGEEVEIILVDDGSTKDNTGEIADRYAERYPDIVRVIHQENGGHGEGVNQGIRHAQGQYYKVVDSDDWVDTEALQRVLAKLRLLAQGPEPLDLMVCNYVYEHVLVNTSRVVNYKSAFPQNRVFTWDEISRFHAGQYLLMHSVIYRTQLLRDCGLELPKHTFYVDNIYVYQPLPHVKSIYYMDEDLYRYFIGREDQSVNEKVMVQRVDQQLRITRIMLDCCDLYEIKAANRKLGRYMTSYLSMMVLISSVFLIISGTEENLEKKNQLWKDIHDKDIRLYRKLKYASISFAGNPTSMLGRKITVGSYHVAQKIYKFN